MNPILNIENLTKVYGTLPNQTRALNGITFQVMPGEFLGIMGSSGSGKSTLLNCIATVIQPTGGSIQVEGDTLQSLKEKALAEYRGKKVGYLFQNFELLDNLTGRENILLPTSLHGVAETESSQRLKQLADYLEITDVLDKFPSKMSGGQRQRVAIGRAIVRDPAVFLMDEPLSNLDAKLRNQMRAEIIKLRQRIDTTFVYVTHDQTEAMTLGDRIVIMKDGFIQQIGTPQEVFDHPANLFVAGFIGTPQMNLFDARLIKQNGKYAVTLDGITVELAEDKQARLAAKDVAEQDVVLGVRPDHIMLCADGVRGKVDVSELMGSSVHLHISTNGHDVVVIVPTNGNAAHFPMGSEVNMIFGGNVAHVFSKETEKNLEW